MNTGRYARFLPVVRALALQSKYPRTKVAAMVFGPGLEIRSSGWNGAPRGSNADVDGRMESRAEALPWVAHAEANAITNAARCGTPLDGCVMLVTHSPCMSCAKLIVQAGIKVVLCPTPDEHFFANWKDDLLMAERLFDECGVIFSYLTEGPC